MRNHRTYLILTPQEEQILDELAGERISAAELTRRLSLPRATVDYTLRKLKQRGFVKTITNGKRNLWTRESHEVCHSALTKALGSLFTTSKASSRASIPGVTKQLQGVDELWAVYEQVASPACNPSKQVQAIQSNISSRAVADRLTQSNRINELQNNVNHRMVTNKIKVDNVVAENYYSSHVARLGRSFLQGFEGRISATSMMPEEFLQEETELWIFNNKVYLLNWIDEYGLLIDNPAVTSMFSNMFTFMHASGKKIDQNAHIKKLLASIDKKQAQ